MKIPETIKVSGVEYKIEEKEKIDWHNKNEICYGSCDYETTTIELVSGLSDERKEQVFIHELTHAIFNEAGFYNHDENLVDRFSIVLHQVLKDNNIQA